MQASHMVFYSFPTLLYFRIKQLTCNITFKKQNQKPDTCKWYRMTKYFFNAVCGSGQWDIYTNALF